MRTYLCIDNDSLDDAKAYRSMQAAMDAYASTAAELERHGQVCTATLHFATSRSDISDYPDRRLSIGPRGGVKVERF